MRKGLHSAVTTPGGTRGYSYDANGNLTHATGPGSRTVATVHRSGTSPTNTTRYLHKDHLGSVVAITSETGTLVESLAYDAWGKRRPASTWQTPSPGVFIAAITLTRGFTMHEHLDQVGLIHMGGRVYDPELGRFLSPDPFVQFPISTQGFNRYAYVNNNPLSYTYPSGYFLKKLMKAAGIGMNFIPGWTLAGNAFIHGFVSGFLASGGDARAGMMGMLSAGIAGEIGLKDLNDFNRALAHGITQGAIAAAGGGRFGDGALGAFSGSLLSFIPEAVAGPYGTGGEGAKIGRMVAAAAVGGTASKLGGGKFANGAWSAAFVSRFNHEQGGFGNEPRKNPLRALVEGFKLSFGGIESDMASAGLADLPAGLADQAEALPSAVSEAGIEAACQPGCMGRWYATGELESLAVEGGFRLGEHLTARRSPLGSALYRFLARATGPAFLIYSAREFPAAYNQCSLSCSLESGPSTGA